MKLSKIRAAHTTRRLAGATIPRNGTASIGRGITLHRASRGRCEVDGKPAMARLDCPERKRSGGRVGKETGGPAVNRISADSESKARALDEKAAFPITGKTIGAGATLGGGMVALGKGIGRKSPLNAAIGAGLTYLGAKLAKDDFHDMRAGTEAKIEAKSIRAGKPIEGEEDRKFGGRAKRKAKDNDGDED